MDDETRKALAGLFSIEDNMISIYSHLVTPKGASKVETNTNNKRVFTGKFEIYGHTLNQLRQLYDDAIAADDAKKKAEAKIVAKKAVDAANKIGDE